MRDSFGRRRVVATIRAAGLFVVGMLVALGLASPANAGDSIVYPNFSTSTSCVNEQGVITVTLIDGSYAATYNITIDDVNVGTNLSEGTYPYSPYAAGDHLVVITYTRPNLADYVNEDTWTVKDCGASTSSVAPTTAASTTAAPTTAAPTTAAPTTAAGSGAAVPTTVPPSASPALPATGRASNSITLIAVLLTALGGALLFVVRQARRA